MSCKNKRNNSAAKLNKQKMNIKKKLMAISLKVDYYIYKNKPISVAEATSHYHEVMSYQALCKHDVRSLQVIEKLSRNMIAIIEEQNGQVNIGEAGFGGVTQNTNDDRVSPVYSMTEEDRNELTMNHRQTASYTESKNNDLNVQNDSANKICEDQFATVVAVEVRSSHTDLHNNSNLKDSVEDSVTFIDLTINERANTTSEGRETCSPSILNNTLRLQTPNMQTLYTDQCAQDIAEVDRVIDDLLKGNKSKSAQENKEKQVVLKTISENSALHDAIPETSKISTIKSNFAMKTKRQVNNQRKTTKPAKQRKIDHTIEYVTTVKNTYDETAHLGKNSSKRGRRSRASPNNNVFHVNDLSWLENITMVREISTHEYEHNNLGEALWENCELPISWEDFVLA